MASGEAQLKANKIITSGMCAELCLIECAAALALCDPVKQHLVQWSTRATRRKPSEVQAAKPPLVEMFTEPGTCATRLDHTLFTKNLVLRLCDISVAEEQAHASHDLLWLKAKPACTRNKGRTPHSWLARAELHSLEQLLMPAACDELHHHFVAGTEACGELPESQS